MLGASQSGRRSSLRLLHVLDHEDVIVEARELATALVGGDPMLAAHPVLAQQVHRLAESDQAEFLDRG